MTLLFISFIAGVLTVLAPCVLPLLPVVIGSSVGGRSKATPYIVIGSLAVSILLFTYLLKASTALITIPPYVWTYLSGGILFGFGLVILFPTLWSSLPFVGKTSRGANKLMGTGHQKKSIWGDVLVGAALGPVFSTCSPTYFVILATVLPASFFLGTVYLLAYIAGLVLVLILIALLGQKLIGRLQIVADSHSLFKKVVGGLFILVGLFIMTGLDKKLETKVLDSGYFNITSVEQKLLDKIDPPTFEESDSAAATYPNSTSVMIDIPRHLNKLFPETDFSKVNPDLAQALSGGPTKDGIPALDNPKFIPISQSEINGSVQAIVLTNENETKVYPYNILTQHEIVNDTFAGTPVAVTFCPLCGSAIVYNRTLPNGAISTFGVSGSLLESNMIMYDRETENLWQQSTGVTLAGSLFPAELTIESFQLLDVATTKVTHPNAQILSIETGHNINYSRNPYGGYDTNDSFIFSPSELNTDLPPKTIMAVFRTNDETPVAVPWLKLREVSTVNRTIENVTYDFMVSDNGGLIISDDSGNIYPFYFEMWFSFAVQHADNSHLIEI